jgi:hypothetical protein
MKEHLPYKAKNYLTGQEIAKILWSPKFHCRVHKEPVTETFSKPDESSPRPHTISHYDPF